ncbi:MAG: hypothetical protein HFJ06_01825 [Lachnospiraceae bacterium]|nr:hypothetical protein [Lachnospiraceae bacterium]
MKRTGKCVLAFMVVAVMVTAILSVNAVNAKEAAEGIKEIYKTELKDVEYAGEIYTYALQKQYQVTDKDWEPEFEEKMGGKKLDQVDCRIISTIPQTKTLEKTKEYKDLLKKDEAKVKDTIKEDGNTYQLKDITWSEEPNIEHVSYTQKLGTFPSEPEHADSYEYTYTSPVTKKENTVTLPFARMEHTEYGWIDGFTATVTFHNLDGEVFNLGNHEFTYNPDRLDFTESDYEELVRMLGYDTSKYRLTGASWSGKPYKDKDGGKNRDAKAYGQQYGASYSAVYEGDIENGTMYTAHAVYTCEVEVPEEEAPPSYIMQATAYYKNAGVWRNIITFVTENKAVSVVSAGILFLFIILAAAMVRVKRRKTPDTGGKTDV